MKRSIAFTGNNYSLLASIVVNRRQRGVRDTGNNINGHVNNILREHFNGIESQLVSMQAGDQIEVTRTEFDTIKVIKEQLKRSHQMDFQTSCMDDGSYIVKRIK